MYDRPYGKIADMYDGDYELHRTPSGDVDFYVEEARKSAGPVLELGCGTGRVLVPTAEAGVDITGLDLSDTMLSKAREKRDGLTLHQGDMRDFDLGRRFRLITIPFRGLSHIDSADDHLRVFANVRKHLEDDGRFIFDVFQPSYKHLAENDKDALSFERVDGDTKIRRYFSTQKHPSIQMMDCEFRWEIEDASGAIEEFREAFTMRWFFRYELEHALARSGFFVETIWGNFDRSPLADDSKELIFVSETRAPAAG